MEKKKKKRRCNQAACEGFRLRQIAEEEEEGEIIPSPRLESSAQPPTLSALLPDPESLGHQAEVGNQADTLGQQVEGSDPVVHNGQTGNKVGGEKVAALAPS